MRLCSLCCCLPCWSVVCTPGADHWSRRDKTDFTYLCFAYIGTFSIQISIDLNVRSLFISLCCTYVVSMFRIWMFIASFSHCIYSYSIKSQTNPSNEEGRDCSLETNNKTCHHALMQSWHVSVEMEIPKMTIYCLTHSEQALVYLSLSALSVFDVFPAVFNTSGNLDVS